MRGNPHRSAARTAALPALAMLLLTCPGSLAIDPPGNLELPVNTSQVNLDDLRPGLAAVYRSLVDGQATFPRLETKPAFFLGLSSPDRRLPPGPFEVIWT